MSWMLTSLTVLFLKPALLSIWMVETGKVMIVLLGALTITDATTKYMEKK